MKMKLLVSSSMLLILSVCVLISCHKKPKETDSPATEYIVTGEIQPTFGVDNLYLDSIYVLSNGFKIKVQEIKFYTSAVQLNGSEYSDYALYNYRDHGTTWFQKTVTAIPSGSLTYNIGVDATKNHEDPSSFPSSSALNSLNANDMYWTWSSGFIFIKIEGKADTLVDGTDNFDSSFSYHLGNDANYISGQTQTLNPTQPASNTYKYALKLDIRKFFENTGSSINVATENYTHSEAGNEVVTNKFRTNFASCISPL